MQSIKMQGFTNAHIREAKAQFYDLLVLLNEFQHILNSSQRSLKPINEAREMIADFLNSILASELIAHFQVLREFSERDGISNRTTPSTLADTTFSTAPCLLFLQDRRGQICYVNSLITSFFETTRDAVIGKTLHEVAEELGFSDAIQTAIRTENRIAIKTGRMTNCEIEVAKNSNLDRIFLTFHPIYDIDMVACVGTHIRLMNIPVMSIQTIQEVCQSCHNEAQHTALIAALIIDAKTSRIIDISDRAATLFRCDRPSLINYKLARLDLLLSNRVTNALQYLHPCGQVAFRHTIYHPDATETYVEVICQLTSWNAHIFVLLNC